MHSPESRDIRGAMVFAHPFAEELNKCRRMAALQARAFADAGWVVLQPDLFGCGDSPGEFGGATWQRWIDDLIEAAAWLQRETGKAPALWGLRAGCLLATDAASRMSTASNLILWQPVASGKQYLQQFLRLSVGSQIVGQGSGPPASTLHMREQLTRGEAVEIMGYALGPALAAGIEAVDLKAPQAQARIAWLEVSGAQVPQLSPVCTSHVHRWQEAGHQVEARVVRGRPFWQTPEVSECAALIDATVAAVKSWS